MKSTTLTDRRADTQHSVTFRGLVSVVAASLVASLLLWIPSAAAGPGCDIGQLELTIETPLVIGSPTELVASYVGSCDFDNPIWTLSTDDAFVLGAGGNDQTDEDQDDDTSRSFLITPVADGVGRIEVRTVFRSGQRILALDAERFVPIAASALTCLGVPVTVDLAAGDRPTQGDDVILGTYGDDNINGLGGNDLICGRTGNDTLRGGAGDDLISGGAGNDRAFGDGGSDYLLGGLGRDVLNGGSGDDRLAGGRGSDSLAGGSGNDTLEGNSGYDRLAGGAGRDFLRGGSGNDRLDGGQNSDTVDGQSGTDRCVGEDASGILTNCQLVLSVRALLPFEAI